MYNFTYSKIYIHLIFRNRIVYLRKVFYPLLRLQSKKNASKKSQAQKNPMYPMPHSKSVKTLERYKIIISVPGLGIFYSVGFTLSYKFDNSYIYLLSVNRRRKLIENKLKIYLNLFNIHYKNLLFLLILKNRNASRERRNLQNT